MDYAIVVLDVGKTNKKAVVYDSALNLLTVEKETIETIQKDGLDVEDVDRIVDWFFEKLKEFGLRYPIRTISISAHGGSFVCVDEHGNLSVPPVAYTNPVPDDFHSGFWNVMGSPEETQKITATAEIKPLINIGKLLWFVKNRYPDDFARTRNILFFPQYFGYRLTGECAADITYIGSHTYLWDFNRSDWSFLVDKLGIRSMLPKKPERPEQLLGTISPSVAKRTGLSLKTKITNGIHDSNSSLIPYIIKGTDNFVLNSTGTWCVAMRPDTRVKFGKEEMGKMVYYNLSFEGNPIKTSILLGGMEYSVYADALMKWHGRSDWPVYNHEIYTRIMNRSSEFVLPTVVPGTGQFPDSEARVIENEKVYTLEDIKLGCVWPKIFENYQEGFALVNLSLAIQTSIALQRAGLLPGDEIFIEGGFRENRNYSAILSALVSENTLYLTGIKEASSFGAALCGKALEDGVNLKSLERYISIEKTLVKREIFEGLSDYVKYFLKHLDS